MNTRVLDFGALGFDFAITSSTNDNKLLTLGKLPRTARCHDRRETRSSCISGIPLGSYFQRGYTLHVNGDGIIARSEITPR